MAVGSRQILYTDSQAPALPHEKPENVSTMQDNSASENTERIKAGAERPAGDPAAPPRPGENLDVRA